MQQDDRELVDLSLGGDEAAFGVLCDRYRQRVWRIAATVASGPDADDVAQEAVCRAYRGLQSYGGRAEFGAWLCRIAVNTAHDYQRSAWRRRVTLLEAPEPDLLPPPEAPETLLERREVQRRVRQAVYRLPEAQRVPISLHYFEGYSLAEVARLEGTPEATVRSRVRAGLSRLSRALGDLMPAPEPSRPLTGETGRCGA